jgi:endoglucanase
MADRRTERRWLEQLTALPTAPGVEHRVLAWVEAWAARRATDLRIRSDRHGNLLLTQKGRRRRAPVVAVAHTDHPGFVVTGVDRREVEVEFRGGVRAEYFDGARVELFDSDDVGHRGRLVAYDPESERGRVQLDRTAPLVPGDIGRWFFGGKRGGVGERFALAPACDDLAGVAAALAALDRARGEPELSHFSVLLTRAEEVGFVGAIGAAKDRTVPEDSRILSIECSRAFPESPLGGGPIVRVGDASSVFDHELTNLVSEAARVRELTHQRKLMAGGSCEATAFVAYGYRATGLCLPLGNYHNMGNLDEVEQGKGMATPLPEVISISDFHGLVDLLLAATEAVDGTWDLTQRLESRFESRKHILG